MQAGSGVLSGSRGSSLEQTDRQDKQETRRTFSRPMIRLAWLGMRYCTMTDGEALDETRVVADLTTGG